MTLKGDATEGEEEDKPMYYDAKKAIYLPSTDDEKEIEEPKEEEKEEPEQNDKKKKVKK